MRGLKKSLKKLKVSASKQQKSNAVEKVKVNNIKKIVKSVLKKNNELKFQIQGFLADKVPVYGSGLNYNGTTLLNGWVSGPSNPYGIIPALSQGTGQGDRIGIKVMPKSMYLRYSVQAMSTTDSTTGVLNTNPFKGVPFRVRVIVFRHKYAIDDFAQSNICEIGNGNASLGSDIDTYFRPYNKAEYTIVYSKTHRMSAIRHISGAGGATVTTENTPQNGVPFAIAKVNIPLPKTLLYNDTVVSNYPTNQNYFLAFAVVNEDSSVITTTQQRITISAETGLYFYDS